MGPLFLPLESSWGKLRGCTFDFQICPTIGESDSSRQFSYQLISSALVALCVPPLQIPYAVTALSFYSEDISQHGSSKSLANIAAFTKKSDGASRREDITPQKEEYTPLPKASSSQTK